MLSELESVGRLALVECVRTGGYDAGKGRFTTYVTPFLDGAMRRHLECSMGTLSLDRDSMGLVRKAQRRYHQKGESVEEISKALGISFGAVARAIAYSTHFFSVYDLQDPEEDGDILERLAPGWLSGSPEETVFRLEQCTMKQLEEHTRRTRPALVKHIKALLKENGGPIEEHASSPNAPRKYYTIE